MAHFRKTPAMQLRRAYLTVHRCFNIQCAKEGTTADQFVILSLLKERKKALVQQELVRLSFSDPNTISAILKRLERKKWIRRYPHPLDGRACCVSMTAAGRKIQKRLTRNTSKLHRHLCKIISKKAMNTVLGALERISSPGSFAKVMR